MTQPTLNEAKETFLAELELLLSRGLETIRGSFDTSVELITEMTQRPIRTCCRIIGGDWFFHLLVIDLASIILTVFLIFNGNPYIIGFASLGLTAILWVKVQKRRLQFMAIGIATIAINAVLLHPANAGIVNSFTWLKHNLGTIINLANPANWLEHIAAFIGSFSNSEGAKKFIEHLSKKEPDPTYKKAWDELNLRLTQAKAITEQGFERILNSILALGAGIALWLTTHWFFMNAFDPDSFPSDPAFRTCWLVFGIGTQAALVIYVWRQPFNIPDESPQKTQEAKK